MSQKDRNQLLRLIALIVISVGLFVFVIRVSPPASPRVAPTRDSQLMTIGVVILALGAGFMRLQQRFAALNPAYQRIIDFLLFILYIGSLPLFVWQVLSAIRFPKVPTDVLLIIALLIPLVIYMGHYAILPAFYDYKLYGLYHRALDILQQWFPRNANLYITRSSAYFEQGELEKAVQAATQAIKLIQPLNKIEGIDWFDSRDWRVINAHNLRMLSFFALAQPELALQDSKVLLNLYPSEPVHYFNHSLAARGAEDFATAAADLKRIQRMKLEPLQRAYLALSQADLASRQGKAEEARDFYDAALTIPLTVPQHKQYIHGEAYGNLSLMELRENNEAAALEMAKKFEALNPGAVSTGLAFIYARRGEWDMAVNQWRRLIMVQPLFAQQDIMRRQYRRDPDFVDLIEQIFVRLGDMSEPPEPPEPPARPSHPLSAL